MPYVITLLCTLGAFSVYPMMVVGRTMSWRTALRMFASVLMIGVAVGVGTGLITHAF